MFNSELASFLILCGHQLLPQNILRLNINLSLGENIKAITKALRITFLCFFIGKILRFLCKKDI